jgi:membrane fusion protein (multidrug efflux system)
MSIQTRLSVIRRHNRITLGIIITAVLIVLSLVMPNHVPADQQVAGADAPEVGVYKATMLKTVVPREYVGRIDAKDTVEVRARIEGFLDKQFFKDGAMVKQGEQLFVIDPREYEAAVAEARARLAKSKADLAAAQASVEVVKAKADLVRDQATLANAEKDLARVRPLAAATAVSIQELDMTETKAKEAAAVVEASTAVVRQAQVNQKSGIALAAADVQQTSAALSTSLLNLSYTKVNAPISGMIGKAEVNVGSLVGKNETSLLATISDLDTVKAYFSLSEQEYLAVMRAFQERGGKYDPSIVFELVLADGQLFSQKGQFDFAERAVDAKTGTLQLRAIFPNPGQLLRPGQFARVRVTNPAAPASLMIPQRAVLEQQGEQFVMVVNAQNKVERKKVKLGARVESQWIVLEGLQAGEQVITDGLQKVRPDMTVQVLPTNQ